MKIFLQTILQVPPEIIQGVSICVWIRQRFSWHTTEWSVVRVKERREIVCYLRNILRLKNVGLIYSSIIQTHGNSIRILLSEAVFAVKVV